ncbi:hypothetical protein [Paenirhodobacter sp. CAU 1674]|uniref:hypothetical protein n=1 Tax=Paenirhodobacter sp. CAU 1674 TaxID=3032596 RepID=UPI0023DBC9ED|nr:hypothetical protein [Paenirhodobacter sp. CAU 1674]MDF2141232.1 hypothetical protein [Paenirhodobacter sp. CAU 1674]
MKWFVAFVACIVLMAGVVANPPYAHAEDPAVQRCYPTVGEISDLLKTRYGEEPFWLGVNGTDGSSGMLMMFARPDRTSWTLVMIDQSGLACALTGGSAWLTRNAKAEEDA